MTTVNPSVPVAGALAVQQQDLTTITGSFFGHKVTLTLAKSDLTGPGATTEQKIIAYLDAKHGAGKGDQIVKSLVEGFEKIAQANVPSGKSAVSPPVVTALVYRGGEVFKVVSGSSDLETLTAKDFMGDGKVKVKKDKAEKEYNDFVTTMKSMSKLSGAILNNTASKPLVGAQDQNNTAIHSKNNTIVLEQVPNPVENKENTPLSTKQTNSSLPLGGTFANLIDEKSAIINKKVDEVAVKIIQKEGQMTVLQDTNESVVQSNFQKELGALIDELNTDTHPEKKLDESLVKKEQVKQGPNDDKDFGLRGLFDETPVELGGSKTAPLEKESKETLSKTTQELKDDLDKAQSDLDNLIKGLADTETEPPKETRSRSSSFTSTSSEDSTKEDKKKEIDD